MALEAEQTIFFYKITSASDVQNPLYHKKRKPKKEKKNKFIRQSFK